MAHIPDGLLSPVLLGVGAAVSLTGCAIGLRRLQPLDIPRVGVLSALFFVASLVHFPVGPSSVHLILVGLTGIMLGWAAFPAIAVGAGLQALLFGFGGFLVLGVNVMNMAVPAVLAGLLFRLRWSDRPLWGGILSGLAVMLTALGVAVCLGLNGQEFRTAAWLVVVSHLPVAGIEGAVSVAVIALLLRVRPAALRGAS